VGPGRVRRRSPPREPHAATTFHDNRNRRGNVSVLEHDDRPPQHVRQPFRIAQSAVVVDQLLQTIQRLHDEVRDRGDHILVLRVVHRAPDRYVETPRHSR